MASTCSVCERDFKTDKAMKKHFTLEHNSHLLPFECEWCLKRYLSEANLVRHARSKHPDIEINKPAYTVFNPSPWSLAEPPAKKKRVVITEPAMVRFKCVPAPVVLSGPPRQDDQTSTASLTAGLSGRENNAHYAVNSFYSHGGRPTKHHTSTPTCQQTL